MSTYSEPSIVLSRSAAAIPAADPTDPNSSNDLNNPNRAKKTRNRKPRGTLIHDPGVNIVLIAKVLK